MKFWDNYIKLLITQGIIALIIILGVVVIKFGFKDVYKEFQDWYKDNVLVDTDINEVIG